MNKKFIIIILIVISLFVGVLFGKQIQAQKDDLNSLITQIAVSPTPVDSLAKEQQCSDDAYRLLDRFKQQYSLDTFSISDDYRQSVFSQKLNTCVTVIDDYFSNPEGKTTQISKVYDTVTGTPLAEYDFNDADTTINFTSDKMCAGVKNCKVTFSDYDSYIKSIGL